MESPVKIQWLQLRRQHISSKCEEPPCSAGLCCAVVISATSACKGQDPPFSADVPHISHICCPAETTAELCMGSTKLLTIQPPPEADCCCSCSVSCAAQMKQTSFGASASWAAAWMAYGHLPATQACSDGAKLVDRSSSVPSHPSLLIS